jgi:plastocyanin
MAQMRKLSALVSLFLLVATGCLGGGSPEKTIFVDFQHDEFASFFLRNFPRKITVAQGDELVFRQFWTGEAHTVTGGTLVDDYLTKVKPYIEKEARGEPIPDETPKDILKLEQRLPVAIPMEEDSDELTQSAAQPCYLARGAPDPKGKPCGTQEQPTFNGKQSYYNSGLIPYEGTQGNEYRVKLADDIEPASYWFYCNVHGPFQSTEVTVKPKGSDVPSAEQIGRQARKEIQEIAEPLLKQFRDAQDGTLRLTTPGSKKPLTVKGRFAGIGSPATGPGAINEFIPRRVTVKAGQRITWNVMGFHTISFGVPKYLPIITFEDDGSVTSNPQIDKVVGAKKMDIPEEELFAGGPEPPRFDGGTYDGTGFWSSGVFGAVPYMEYSLRISKPGTYRYACLIHPPMVGTLEVT